MKHLFTLTLALLYTMGLSSGAYGAVVTWDGGQGTDSWSDPNN